MTTGYKKRTNVNNIPLLDVTGYGIGNLGYGIVIQIIASYLVFYGTAVLNVQGSLIGLAISISVIWDGFTDPLMGYISDKTHFKKLGRRHLYVIIGSIGIAIFNYFLWIVNTELSTIVKFTWILVNLLIVKSFLTVFVTPYTALGAELSTDYGERTLIQGTKTIFFLSGIGLATVLGIYIFFAPTAEYPIGQLNPQAYKNMGLSASLIMFFSGIICFFSTYKYIPFMPKAPINNKKTALVKRLYLDFKSAFTNSDYKNVVYAYLFTNIASALITTFGLHVFTYTFSFDNKSIAYIFGIQVIMCILTQPIWIKISKKLDKKPTAILGLSITLIGSLYFVILVLIRNHIQGNIVYMIPYALITGFGISGLFTLPLSMIADTIDVEEDKYGTRSEGVYYGCLTLFYKLSQSIVIFLLGIILDIIKFNPQLTVQPQSTLITLGLVIPIGSIISFCSALYCYSRYSLNKNIISNVQKSIQLRRKK